jgi:hypothetical protein
MEVEVSRKSLDCSRYGLFAMVADNSHLCSPRGWKNTHQLARLSIVLITSHATVDPPGKRDNIEQSE